MKIAEHHKATPVEVFSSETIFKGRVFTLNRDRIREPGGIEAVREIIVHPGSVVVLPVLPDGRVLMIRQYRHAAGQTLWELVAGHREEHETFLEAAPRELQEETGYTARRFIKLTEFYPSPGLLSEKMVVYLAEGLIRGQANQEADEKIAHRAVSLTELQAWIRTGKIKDAKSIAGILYYSKFAAAGRRKSAASKRQRQKR